MKSLFQRAYSYSEAKTFQVQWDPIDAEIVERSPALSIRTAPVETVAGARFEAAQWLRTAGVSADVVADAFALLDIGAGLGGATMRGGVIMDAATGERLEPDPSRGVRATRMDYTPACRSEISSWLGEQGLTSHRIMEAVAVATKAAWSGAVAEIGWSDDPGYVAGYVASAAAGYCRFERMKEPDIARGGRVFFLERPELTQQFMERMERTPLLIDRMTPGQNP